MKNFIETTHFSEILERSQNEPVIVFKYSNNCGTSDVLRERLSESKIRKPIFLVTVQTMPELSRKIEDWFEVKHESPQIFLINKKKMVYTAHHKEIDINKL